MVKPRIKDDQGNEWEVVSSCFPKTEYVLKKVEKPEPMPELEMGDGVLFRWAGTNLGGVFVGVHNNPLWVHVSSTSGFMRVVVKDTITQVWRGGDKIWGREG